MKRSVINNIEEAAIKAKVEIERIVQGGKHIKVQVKGNKSGVVFVSVSASDYRAFQNVTADMKKVGYYHD
jgi:biotin carboxylase